MSFFERFLDGTSHFCMEGESGGEGETGGGGGESGGDGAHGTGTPTGDGGGKAPFGQTPPSGAEGEGGDGGSKQVDIKALLGDELASNKSLEKYMGAENPVQELGKALIHAQSQVGKQQYAPPPEDASDEQKAAYREAIGVPGEPKDYEFGKPENWPEALPYDQEHADAWAQKMHDKGVPKTMAQELRNEFMQEMMEGASAQSEAANAALNEAFTKQFGDDAGKLAKEAGALMKEAIPDAETREAIEAAIGDQNTPAFGMALGAAIQHLKTKYGLGDTNIGDAGAGQGGQSIEELRGLAQKKMASPEYRDPMSAGHASVKQEVKDLYDQIGQLQDAKTSAKNR